MRRFRRLRITFGGICVALVLVFAAASFLNSEGLDAVTVRFAGPGREPADAVVLGKGKGHILPDYRLEIVHSGGRFACGTVPDTSADAEIRFVVSDEIPVRRVQELVLVEDDSVNDDLVTRVQFVPPEMASAGYVFAVESSRSFGVGLSWFFSTALGKAIALGITIAVVLIILMSLS